MKPNTAAAVTAFFVSAAVGLLFYLFVPCRSNGSPIAGAPTQTRYDQIRARDTIRAAYAVGAPLFSIDPNSKRKSGIFFEIVEGAAARLGLKVAWTDEVGYGQMIEGLKTKYDVVGSGVWTNAARGKDADFTIPAYYDAVLAYVREGDTRFDRDISLLNTNSFKISTMDGELGTTIAASDFPSAKTEPLPQSADFSQLIQNVINKKADAVFLALAAARSFQAKNPGKIRAVSTSPLRVFPVAILLPKGATELQQSLNYAITEMLTNGEIDAILRKYETVPGSFIRTAAPYRTAESLR